MGEIIPEDAFDGRNWKIKNIEEFIPKDKFDCNTVDCLECKYREDEHCFDDKMREFAFKLVDPLTYMTDQTYKPDFESEKNEILMSYAIKKSNFMKYKPTDKEITNAVLMYKNILTDAEHQEELALECIEILKSKSENTEVQIRLLGAMFEATSKFPDEISQDALMNISEKWDVLDYMTKEMLDLI
jgi:hypothetical protein